MRDAQGKGVRAAEQWGQCRSAPDLGLAVPWRLQTFQFTVYPKNAYLKTGYSNWFARTIVRAPSLRCCQDEPLQKKELGIKNA